MCNFALLEDGYFNCKTCRRRFHTKTGYKIHSTNCDETLNSSNTEEKEEKSILHQSKPSCRNEENGLSLKSDLQRNIKASPNEKLKPYLCQQCQKSFRQKANLQIHIKTVHDKLRAYQCLRFVRVKNLLVLLGAIH